MKLKTIAATVCAMFACGCVSTSTGGFEVSVGEGDPAATLKIDDLSFAERFSVETAGVRREPSGFISAQVRLRNRQGQDASIQYKFAFFSGDGMEIQPDARPWEQTTIHGGETVSLSAVAPDKSAVRFVVRIRRAM